MNKNLKTILITVGIIAGLIAAGYGIYRVYNLAVADATAKIKAGVKEGVEEGVAGGVGKMLNPLNILGIK